MKTKDFKQVTVSGKIYQWKIDEKSLSVWKDGKKILEKNVDIKPTANVVRDIVSEYLTTLKPVKLISKSMYGTFGSHYFDIKK